MSFIAPYAVTGAISLYLGYKTYSSYYSNCEFEELTDDNEENEKVVKELVDSMIREAVKNIEDEQCSQEDTNSQAEEEVETPKTVEEIREEVKEEEPRINKIIEEVKREENVRLTNYDNMVSVVNKTLEKMEKPEEKVENVKIIIEDVDTNNENVVEEVIKSPIQKSKNQNNLKKRKKRKHKK